VANNRLFSGSDSSSNDVLTAQLRSLAHVPAPNPALFMPVAGPNLPGYAQWQQMVLQMAYQLARAIVAPPRHEQLLTSSWN
jgi:hypothetical protein